jgi:hypothetical protein
MGADRSRHQSQAFVDTGKARMAASTVAQLEDRPAGAPLEDDVIKSFGDWGLGFAQRGPDVDVAKKQVKQAELASKDAASAIAAATKAKVAADTELEDLREQLGDVNAPVLRAKALESARRRFQPAKMDLDGGEPEPDAEHPSPKRKPAMKKSAAKKSSDKRRSRRSRTKKLRPRRRRRQSRRRRHSPRRRR